MPAWKDLTTLISPQRFDLVCCWTLFLPFGFGCTGRVSSFSYPFKMRLDLLRTSCNVRDIPLRERICTSVRLDESQEEAAFF
jgi:hypothetical protein